MANTTEEQQQQPAGHTVFFGNLPYSITEDDLRNMFQGNSHLVRVKIVTRGNRSRGYGFVEFDNEEAAQAAVAQWNKKTFEGREINVECGRPRDPNAPVRDSETSRNPHSHPRSHPQGCACLSMRGRGRGRFSGNGHGAVSAEGENTTNGSTAVRGGRGGRGRGFGRRQPNANGENAKPRVESKTVLFVANLPFSVNDEQLKNDVFAGFNVKSSRVVMRMNGSSRGFGFVDLENEAERDKALNAVNGKTVDGRQLSVKVALETTDLAETDVHQDA